jgi:hypothetical protein
MRDVFKVDTRVRQTVGGDENSCTSQRQARTDRSQPKLATNGSAMPKSNSQRSLSKAKLVE